MHQALAKKFGHLPFLTIANPANGVPTLKISTPAATAGMSLFGAQVLSWAPRDHQNVLWLSPSTSLDGSAPIRGGIPVCWPWFGPHPEDPSAPAHGIARTALWYLDSATLDDETAILQFSGPQAPSQQSLGQPGLQLSLGVRIGEILDLALTTTNIGTQSATLSQALHSYFAVGAIQHISIDGFDKSTYLDKLDDGRTKQQSGLVQFEEEVDRIYNIAPTTILRDPLLSREIKITSQGTSRSTVIWNPWSAKSQRLDDMPDDGYKTMVCIETANVAADTIKLPPGASHTLRALISVATLTD